MPRQHAEQPAPTGSQYARSLIEASLDPLVTISPEGKITDVNEATVKVTGVAREALIGTDFSNYFTEPEKAREGYQQVFEKGFMTDYLLTIRHKDGRLADVLYNASVYKDGRGNVLGAFATARDITARKRAEEALRRSERNLGIQNRIAQLALTIQDDEMYAEVLGVVLEATESGYGVFGYMDEKGALVVPSMSRHIWDRCQVPDKTIVFPRETWGESIWPRAVRQKKTLYSNEPSALTPPGHIGVLRNITLPILYRGEVIGLFQVANKETDYDEGDIHTLEDIAGYIAPVLAARLQRDTLERSRRKAEAELQRAHSELECRVQERTAELAKTNEALQAEIAERRHAEETLRESERRFRSLVTATAQVVWSTDGEGRVTGPIPTWQAYTGQTDDEIRGSGWAGALHPDDVQRSLAAWTHAVGTRTLYDVDYRIRGRDGAYRHFSVRGVPIVADDGAIHEWVGTCTDITERKQAEEAVQNAEARYRAVFEQSPNGVVLIEAETGKIIEANEVAHKQLGYTRDEFAALTVLDYEASETPEETAAHIQRVIREGSDDFETQHRAKGGELRSVHVWAKTIRFNERLLFYAVFEDVTDRKRAERELAERAEELARSNRELEQFAYVASHDLQEPLRMVSSYTELLGRRYKGKLDTDADEFIAYAVEGATRLQTMINDLLTYSRLGRTEWSAGPVDCHAVLAQALANLSVAIEESHALVTSDPLPTVPANEMELTQLLQNLIANAIKFRSEQPPVVHVSARRSGAEWVFAVCDNGIGIAPDHCERIFVIFQRLNPRDRYSGTGIGLAICKKVVEHHRGRIWVESAPGGGSTFFFTIPEKERATS